MTPGKSASSIPSAKAATGAAATLPAHLRDTRVAVIGTRWMMATTTTRRRTLTTTTRTQATEVEVGEAGDTVTEVGEGSAIGGTSGGNKYIIT